MNNDICATVAGSGFLDPNSPLFDPGMASLCGASPTVQQNVVGTGDPAQATPPQSPMPSPMPTSQTGAASSNQLSPELLAALNQVSGGSFGQQPQVPPTLNPIAMTDPNGNYPDMNALIGSGALPPASPQDNAVAGFGTAPAGTNPPPPPPASLTSAALPQTTPPPALTNQNLGGTRYPGGGPETDPNAVLNWLTNQPGLDWLGRTGWTPLAFQTIDPRSADQAPAYAMGYASAQGVNNPTQYADQIEPLVQSAPDLYALAHPGAGVLDPYETATAEDQFIQSMMTPIQQGGTWFDPYQAYQNFYTSPDLTGIGAGPDMSYDDQASAVMQTFNELLQFMPDSNKQAYSGMMNRAYTAWQQELLKGNTVSFLDYLKSIGADAWM